MHLSQVARSLIIDSINAKSNSIRVGLEEHVYTRNKITYRCKREDTSSKLKLKIKT